MVPVHTSNFTITHVVNPFKAKEGSEHDRAQRITFASILAAIRSAKEHDIAVQLVCPVLPSDIESVPADGIPAILTRTVQDYKSISPKRLFPLISDLLNSAIEKGDGDYVVYTNVDIALKPQFYVDVTERVRQAAPQEMCMSITRRTLPDTYAGPEELQAMYDDSGKPHPGHDCFVFPRSWIPKLKLGKLCIAARHFDSLLIANLDAISGGKFQILREEQLTFHLGDDQAWLLRPAYDEFNFIQGVSQVKALAKDHDITPGSHFEYLYNGYVREAQLIRTVRRRLKHWLILKGLHYPKHPQ